MIFIIAREFAQRPSGSRRLERMRPLQNVFRSPGQVQALRVLDHPVGLALHHRRHLQEVVVDQDINLYALMPLFRVDRRDGGYFIDKACVISPPMPRWR
jgi:3-polyprenyl-4-hydroxybenzoate decarboxylase